MRKYLITGMTCAACSARVEKAVSKLEGIESCSVSLLTNSMQIVGTTPDEEIIKTVEKAGYGVKNINKKNLEKNKIDDNDTKKLIKRLILSVFFLLILMYFSMGHMMFNLLIPKFFKENYVALGILQMLLTIIILIINKQFFINGFKNLIKFSPNMDSLIAIGSGVSFLYSLYGLFALTEAVRLGNNDLALEYVHNFHFETASMIVTLITIGKTLEAYSKGKTTNALKSLIDLTPKTATIFKNNENIIVNIEQLNVGDIIIVKAGETIPVDGKIISGNGSIDESSITGESIPVDKEVNSKVVGGTILKAGYIMFEAEKVGENTTISQIIKMVEDASSSKAPIAKIADKVSGIFVPVVLGIAIITLIIWLFINHNLAHALDRAVSVLVISCPCALGLATPVAIMVGNGIGARSGILFKTAESLELTGKTKIIALDKTGTITKGEPVVTDLIPLNSYTKDELIKIAYAIENLSEHPLSKAITTYAISNNYFLNEVSEFKTLSGLGISAKLNDDLIYAGSLKYISSLVNINENEKKLIHDFANLGKTPLLFVKNKDLIGVICVADVIKEDSKYAISEIKKLGIKVIMITGDNELTANAIAKKVGVDSVYANVLPNEKGNVIEELKKQGNVIMVGDGINDALALTCADIGIAIGAGSDVAIDAADVVLVNSKLTDVYKALKISKSTILNIYENLFWAFIYNVLGIPLAAGVYSYLLGWELNPMFGAAAMSLSSFCVVCNALRLNLKKFDVEIKKTKLITNKFAIEGMMCKHCEQRVENLSKTLNNVVKVKANHKNGNLIITSNRIISNDEIISVLKNSEYEIKK